MISVPKKGTTNICIIPFKLFGNFETIYFIIKIINTAERIPPPIAPKNPDEDAGVPNHPSPLKRKAPAEINPVIKPGNNPTLPTNAQAI
jgi:hypothetical protein